VAEIVFHWQLSTLVHQSRNLVLVLKDDRKAMWFLVGADNWLFRLRTVLVHDDSVGPI
jgi:hypothetical protein